MNGPTTTFRFLSLLARSYPWRTVAAVALLAVAGLAEGVGTVTLIPVLEVIGDEGSGSGIGAAVLRGLSAVGLDATLETLLALIFFAMLLKAALMWLAMTTVGKMVIALIRDLRMRLVRNLLRVRWQYLGAERAGSWAAAISTEANQAGAAYREAVEMLAALFPITVYLVLATVISWSTTLFAVATASLLVWVLRRFVEHSRRAGRAQVLLTKNLAAETVDILQGLKPIKAMAREGLSESLFAKNVRDLEAAMAQTLYANWNVRFFQEPTVTLFMAGAILFLSRVGGLPLGNIMILAFVFYRIMTHVNTLQSRYQVLVTGEAAFWSLWSRLEETSAEEEDIHRGLAIGPLRDTIEFDDVSFGYEDKPVAAGLNLQIKAGAFIAILGGSGAGKTTLIDLLVGLLRPTSGRILVDGVDLLEIQLKSWRHQIGYVPQEMLLLNDSIRRNVDLGDPSVREDDVRAALKAAGAWDFVATRPKGIDEPVGERGTMLSGGERQRIAIARALVRRPSLLVLDEVTTALDPATEQSICETLRHLAGSVTIVSISHQPAMRRAADIAYVMQEGRLGPPLAAVARAGSWA